jgi:hypothetical protein
VLESQLLQCPIVVDYVLSNAKRVERGSLKSRGVVSTYSDLGLRCEPSSSNSCVVEE